ncbi:putative ribonuclease H protein [Corchorus capsularis]|uniref:Putative ribonuclease H protein n=1 Tax=Corchorus capsularis TaxID=210143 RepID=A0A1R3JQA8_COCAP|nr:putative ribonuclease H protein [Corchorus capsularis]
MLRGLEKGMAVIGNGRGSLRRRVRRVTGVVIGCCFGRESRVRIIKGDDVLDTRCRIIVKSGHDTSIWFDRWLTNCDSNLRSLNSGPLHRNEDLLRVADCLDGKLSMLLVFRLNCGVRDGFKLALDKRIIMLEETIDAQVVIDLIHKAIVNLHPLGNLITDCRNLMSQFHRLKFLHCYREGNRFANVLTNLGRSFEDNFPVSDCIPYSVFDVFMDDIMGLSMPRLVNA